MDEDYEEDEKEFNFKDWASSMSFPILIIVSILVAGTVGGFVKSGMFMGMMATIAIWTLVIKFPLKVKVWMSKNILLSDLVLSIILFTTFSSMIGTGPTVFMASVTQAVLLSILLNGLQVQYAEVTFKE